MVAGFYGTSSRADLATPFQLDSQSFLQPPPNRPVRSCRHAWPAMSLVSALQARQLHRASPVMGQPCRMLGPARTLVPCLCPKTFTWRCCGAHRGGFGQGLVAAPGTLNVFNTLERFKGCDHAAALAGCAHTLWADMSSGAAEADPRLLTRFLLLAHADLKAYRYCYWCVLCVSMIATRPLSHILWRYCVLQSQTCLLKA